MKFPRRRAAARLCAQRGRSLIELAFGWLLSRPLVGCVIAGASRPEQIEQNVKALGWTLDAAEMREVDRLSANSDHRFEFNRQKQCKALMSKKIIDKAGLKIN